MEKLPENKREFEIPKKSEDEGYGTWVLSYGDMVTLLFSFFIILFALSQINKSKMEQIAQYFTKEQTRMPLSDLEKKIKELVAQKKLESDIQVKLTDRGVEINFRDKLLFDLGKTELKETSFPIMITMSYILNHPRVSDRMITIEGHTDSIPITSHIFPSNWELSTARASSVVRFFLDRGVLSGRFEAVGYADTHPLVPEEPGTGGTPANRRVVLIVRPDLWTGFKPASFQATPPPAQELATPTTAAQPVAQPAPEIPADKLKLMQEHYKKGVQYLNSKKYKKAVTEFQQVLKIDPGHEPSLLRLKKAKGKLSKK